MLQPLNETRREREDRLYVIAAKTNFGAHIAEVIGTILALVVHFAVSANLTSYLIMGIIFSFFKFIITWCYVMNSHQLKDIVIYKGWTVGFQFIFHTSSGRQEIMNEVQIMMQEMRSQVAENGDYQIESIVATSSSNKPKNSGDELEDAPLIRNVAFGLDKEYQHFKKFYRQSSINTMIENYETMSFEFNICLDNLVELEETCRDDQYHFDNDLFAAWFNKFNLQRGGRSMPNSKGGRTNILNRGTPSVAVNKQTLFDQSDYNIKLTLQNMVDNVDNDVTFGRLLRQLQDSL